MKRIAVLLALAACKHSEPTKPDTVVVPVTPNPTPVSVVDAGAPPTAPSNGSKVRAGAPGDTRGTISCGANRCKAEQETCALRDGLWSCVELEKAPTSDRRYDCDDVSDCTEHGYDICCSADLKSGYCGNKNAADSTPCDFAACNTDQGAPSCPTGQSCVEGICRPPPPRATCTGKKQCPAETPVCLWSLGKGTCVANDKADASALNVDVTAFECSRPSDCGAGFTCCAPGGNDLMTWTRCQAACGQDLEVVCEKSSECPAYYMTGAVHGLVPTACQKRQTYGGPPLPAWSGKCAN